MACGPTQVCCTSSACAAGCFGVLAEVQLDSFCAVRLLAPRREVRAQLQAVCAGHVPAMLAAVTAAEAAAAGAAGTEEPAHDVRDVGLQLSSRTVLAQAVLLAVALQPEAAHSSHLAVLEPLFRHLPEVRTSLKIGADCASPNLRPAHA